MYASASAGGFHAWCPRHEKHETPAPSSVDNTRNVCAYLQVSVPSILPVFSVIEEEFLVWFDISHCNNLQDDTTRFGRMPVISQRKCQQARIVKRIGRPLQVYILFLAAMVDQVDAIAIREEHHFGTLWLKAVIDIELFGRRVLKDGPIGKGLQWSRCDDFACG